MSITFAYVIHSSVSRFSVIILQVLIVPLCVVFCDLYVFDLGSFVPIINVICFFLFLFF